MKNMHRLLAIGILTAAVLTATPLHAQIGGIGSLGGCFGPGALGQRFAELLARQAEWDRANREWFLRNGFDASVGRNSADYLNYPIQPMRAPGFTQQPPVKTYYDIGNQAPYTIRMGPAVLNFRGAGVRMIEGHRIKKFEDEVGNSNLVCDGSFNWLHAYTGWANAILSDTSMASEGAQDATYRSGWIKGFLTRAAVRTHVQDVPDTCGRLMARYVYRYQYHAPDGTIIAFYQRPREVPASSVFASGCGTGHTPAPEPNFYFSSDGAVTLDTSNKCKPVMRWADGSTEEFHGATTQPFSDPAGSFLIAPPFEPTCSATDMNADLRRTDRNGNVTTFRYTTAADGSFVQTMTDPQGRQTVLTYDISGLGVPRLRSVETPSIGIAPPLRYTINWIWQEIRFDQIWPDVTCSPEFGTTPGCGTPIAVDLVESIVVPDGRRYSFQYGAWGNLTRVTAPGGAVHEYVYGDAANLSYANAVVPLMNRMQSSDLCGPLWSDGVVKMQARGLVRERVLPDGAGIGRLTFEKQHNFVLRKLAVPGCSFDTLGAATAGPDGCAQVWMETTEPDGTVVKRGTTARALPHHIPNDDRFSIPPNVPVEVHGRSIGQETWSGATLVAAHYNGDKDTGQLWYESELVKAVRLPVAVPAGLRATRSRTFRDGLTTTTNFVHGHSVDIDPTAGVELRRTAVTSICVFGGIVGDAGCATATPPLMRTEMSYVNQFETFFAGNIMNLNTAKRVYGPASSAPLIETTFAYDEFPLTASGRPSTVLDPARGGVPRGNVTTTTERVTATKTISTKTRYFDNGSIQSITDPMNFTTTFEPSFALCSTASPNLTSRIKNALGHTATTLTDCFSDLTLRSTDANGHSTYTQYDYLGRPVESAGPGDVLTALPQSGSQPFTRDPSAPTGAGTQLGQAMVTAWTEYLSQGVYGAQRTVEHVRDGSPGGLYKKIFTDGLGRVVQTRAETDATKNGAAEIVTTTVYDSMGRVSNSLTPCFAAASDVRTAHCGTAGTLRSFDALGREVNVTEPGGRVTTHVYGQENGRWVQTTTNPRGFKTKTHTSLLGHTVQIDRESPRCAGGYCTSKATFDAAGRMLTQSDPNGNTITYQYDNLGRRTSMSDPDLGAWSYEYDDNGNLTAQTDAKGQRASFGYDAINRMTLKDLAPAGPSTDDVSFSYDGAGPVPPADNPVPTIVSFSPAVVDAGSAAFTLTVNGSGFVNGAVVKINGQSRVTTFVGAQQLQAAVPATDVQTAGPLSVTVTNPPPGGGTSAASTFTVNRRPTVTLTSPANGRVFTPAPATIPLSATVTDDTDGATVTYYNGTTAIGSSSTPAAFAFDWTNVPAGQYTLKARVTDRHGSIADSPTVTVTVAAAPTVTMTAPTNGQVFREPVDVTLSANASSAAGIAKVAFFRDATLVAEDTTAPYSVVLASAPRGTYTIHAKATDNNGVVTSSAGVSISVTDAPVVSLVWRTPGQTYVAPATVFLEAGASDADGIREVAFYQNGSLLAVDTASPYRYDWTNVPAGNYRITAVATDTKSVSTTSAPTDIVVQPQPANAARFISQLVPTSMLAGRQYTVTVTMQNRGTATWTAAANYALGSQQPQDNLTWGVARAVVPGSVATDAQVSIQFTVRAPSTPGTYAFQWRMVQDGVAWFGDFTPTTWITVTAAAVTMINLSQGMAPNQSSALTGYPWTDARLAVDGNTDGNYAAGSVTHTATQANPYWQLDLPASASIVQIDLWNRTDCCSERLSNFYVFVSNAHYTSADPVTTSRQSGVWSYYSAGQAPTRLTIPVNVVGRHIRVQIAGTTALSLAEVQVFGFRAEGGSTSQSSTYAGPPAGNSWKAVDGNTNGIYSSGSVTETNSEVQPWWETDLGSVQAIDRIEVWNRTDGWGSRLTDFYVVLSEVPFTSKNLAATLSQPGVLVYRTTGQGGWPTSIPVVNTARYVRVQLASGSPGILSMAEVRIFCGGGIATR